MDALARVLLDGPVMLLSGVVLVLLGGAGLLSTGGASYSRMRTTNPAVFWVQLVLGVLLLAGGAAALIGR